MKELLVTVLLLILVQSLLLLGYSLTRRDRLQSIYFTVLTMAIAAYSLGYALEMMAPDLAGKIVAIKIENIGIPLLAPFFMLMTLKLCDYRIARMWMGVAVGTVSFALFLAVMFNESHYLYYSSYTLITEGGWSYVLLGHGPLYLVQQALVATYMLIAYVALAHRYHMWSPKVKKQMIFVVLGSLVTLFANIANILKVVPYGLDITPFASAVSMLFFSISIFRYRLFDVVTYASEMAVQTMDDAIVVLDEAWCYLSSNESARKLFPSLEGMLANTPMTHAKDWPSALQKYNNSNEQINFKQRGDDGAIHFYRARISSVGRGRSPFGWSIVIRDMSETTRLMQQLEVLATTDSLTGIYNRRHFIEMVGRELELAKRHPYKMALIMFDLDHFKKINDNHGHLFGDKVLRTVVGAVKNELRPYDIFARYGGEEFVIFVMFMDEGDAAKLAQRLCDTVAAVELENDGTPVPVTASFGVTEMHARDKLDIACAAVDDALYAAKKAGRNCVRVQQIERAPGEGKVYTVGTGTDRI